MKIIDKLKKRKAEIIVGSGALIAGVLSFYITLGVYPLNQEKTDNNNISIAKENKKINIDVDSEQKPSLITKNDEEYVITNNKQKIDVEENNMEEVSESDVIIDVDDVQNANKIEMIADISENEGEVVEALATNISEDITQIKEKIQFDLPVSGEIILEFADEKLVYSETLNEWIIHSGIDIKGDEASPVKAAENGIVESVKMDPRYGNTIIIKHDEEYKTVYSNLSTLDLVYVGKNVKKGDIISGIGAGFGFEIKEGPHVHFEILKNKIPQNPD